MYDERNHILDTPIGYLKGVGPKRAEALGKELSMFTFGDLLHHFPFRYVDKTKLYVVRDITPDTQYVQLRGTVIGCDTIEDGKMKRFIATLRDKEGGIIELVWFKSIAYMQRYVQRNVEYMVFGKPNFFKQKVSMPHPEMEMLEPETEISLDNRFEAIYSTTEKLKNQGLDSRGIHRLLKALWERLSEQDLPEILPPYFLSEYKLISRYAAYKNIHLPQNDTIIAQAEYRLKFDEFFMIQMRLLRQKSNRHRRLIGYKFDKVGDYFHKFYSEQLPFELTGAQKRVVKDLRRDTLIGMQMNRLVQGDVGSGKTMVALLAMLLALDNGFQSCMMAPTEILAQQHYEKLSELMKPLNVRVELLTGSVKGKKRRLLLEALQLGMIHFLIGTHALLEDEVTFKNLGMVIVDEQHRFGVAQRARLWQKNEQAPHVLVMTATPIPRTLAMTLYGDLDVSVIDELPPGRKPITTYHAKESQRLRIFGFIRQELDKGRQVYIVYPLINESEKMSYQNLMDGYESIARAFPPPDFQISIVHGQMSAADKDFEMQRFKNHETHIMVATTVIEVGVDVPNASLMLIESAERFGLSQLHQLRGRVGRGAEQSYCVLMTGDKLTADARRRIATMVETSDGFKIAEVDMELRGPGDMQGTQQSGMLQMRIANLAKDQQILQIARNAAANLLHNDPNLQQPEHKALLRYLQNNENRNGQSEWSRIS
jgi:ATP-dependent DNA helicase RecG